ncbi:uncharacterized protein C1orf131 homolog isoform X2 [Dromaius novaehollandiae]|uniref:uncharacterized protein C1orf131 homolog isoform X2 n=1 Tax=Dromaius novaehollandiae TaxID=8790 RepID=UPI00311F4E4C
MGAREQCRRLEAVLGALYDLGDEGDAEKAQASGAEEPAGAAAAADPGGGGSGGAGGRPRGAGGARGFFGALRAELRGAEPCGVAPRLPAAPPTAVQVVVFRGAGRTVRPRPAASPGGGGGGAQTRKVAEEKNVNKHEFNFEKARLEVHKFGITGYEKQEQRVWEQERAIMLGAKPPKKEHVNYKTYQEKMKEKKTRKDDNGKEHKGDSLKKKKTKEQKERKAKKKKSVPSIWPAGQVGKFRDGTLILHSSDIKKIKSSKVMK